MWNGTYFRPPIYELVKVLENKEKSGIKPDLFILAAPLGFEPGFSPWKGGVLTIRRWGQNLNYTAVSAAVNISGGM